MGIQGMLLFEDDEKSVEVWERTPEECKQELVRLYSELVLALLRPTQNQGEEVTDEQERDQDYK